MTQDPYKYFRIEARELVDQLGTTTLELEREPSPELVARLLRLAHTRPFEMRGRAMEGWLRVDAAGLRTKRQLERWVARSVAHARTLPRKR